MQKIDYSRVLEFVVFIQLWEQRTSGSPETEKGFSLHLSMKDAREYVRHFWEEQPIDDIPVRYTCPVFGPFKITVSHELCQELLIANSRGDLGIRKLDSPPHPIPYNFTTLNGWDAELLKKAREHEERL